MTAAMELLYPVVFLLLTRPGVTFGDDNKQCVVVKEGSDVVLPCSIKDTPLNYERFDWKKGQKEVFMHDAGTHSNNGHGDQDPQFKGRVSHFEDELRNGNASIKIRNTTVEDSGDYSCIFPNLQNQIFHIELVVFVGPVKVKEGSDVVLPCSLDQKDLTNQVFDWKKDGKKEVFLHERVSTDPNKREGQHSQFKGRVSRFEDELRDGNASIKISDTKLEDSGVYSCYFPHLQNQIFYIKLVVDPVLKKRNITGAAPELSVRTVDHTAHRALLQCAVKGASPKPRVEWKDSAGKVLHSVVTHEDEVNERFYIIFQTRVTQTGYYNCVVTQYDIGHQVFTKTFVLIGASSKPYITILDETKDWSLLQCEVHGALSKPVVQWKDSSGNIVPAKESQVTERGGSYDIILQTIVTKTDHYRCVATQEEIKHQVYSETEVYICGSQSPGWGWLILAFVFGVVITFSAQKIWPVLRKRCRCGPIHIRVFVKEGSDAVLPCSPGKLDLTRRVFIWKKGKQNVFLYAEGMIANGGPLGQDQQFRGRVSHFGGQLHLGNASIKIHNTTVEDSGIYTCKFPGLGPLQTVSVKLIVGSADSEADSNVDDEAVPLSTKGPSDVTTFVEEGSDAVLSCSPGSQDLTGQVFIWKKGEQNVFLYAEGMIENGGPLGQDQQFRGRVSHFRGELQHGNASIKIHNTKAEDSGIYACEFRYLDPPRTFSVKLIVVSADSEADSNVDDEAVPLSAVATGDVREVGVEKGCVVILPYILGSQDLTNEVFEWKKGEQKVFLYDKDKIENGGPLGQDEQFKGRVSHFGDELQHGNASIKIHKTKVEDSGIYTCYFTGPDRPQTFSVKLVVSE